MLNKKAYTEVYYIIKEMSEEMKNKIPKHIMDNIEENMDKNYDFTINVDEDWKNLELLEDTEKILSVLYADYFATDEERKVILAKERAIREKARPQLPKVKVKKLFQKI